MIISILQANKNYELVDKKFVDPNKNIFTILVGKNGAGKSRLLSSIISDLLDIKDSGGFVYHSETLFPEIDIKIDFDKHPDKIIAVSTSPFDKFPLKRFRRGVDNYSYLGIRELMTQNFGLSYVSKILGALIESVVIEPLQMSKIVAVLKNLGFRDSISIRFNSRIHRRYLNEFLTLDDPYSEFEIFMKERRNAFPINRRFFENEDESISKNKVNYLVKALRRIKDASEFTKGFASVLIDKNGLQAQYSFKEFFEDLIFYINGGIIRLEDIVLEKVNGGYYSLSGASSGEQSAIISILGIASQIKNNSLICIDEPEICLHPDWQGKYMKLLVDTFNTYNQCHFIIATHSPQIVSNLSPNNSFILSLETGEMISSNEIIKRSADFQLANVFNSPGFKNEYLIRIALNTFSKVAKNKIFDDKDEENFELLKTASKYLSENDPVLDLFNAINEMHLLYA